MSEVLPGHTEALALDVARCIDQVCSRFETAWKTAGPTGPCPRIEDYLTEIPESARAALVCELIAVEVDYRRQRGEAPRPQDYQARFRDLDPAWLAGALAPSATAAPDECVAEFARIRVPDDPNSGWCLTNLATHPGLFYRNGSVMATAGSCFR